jgi:hypothetical protein
MSYALLRLVAALCRTDSQPNSGDSGSGPCPPGYVKVRRCRARFCLCVYLDERVGACTRTWSTWSLPSHEYVVCGPFWYHSLLHARHITCRLTCVRSDQHCNIISHSLAVACVSTTVIGFNAEILPIEGSGQELVNVCPSLREQ